MILFFWFTLMAAEPSPYVQEWKNTPDHDCGRVLFLAGRLKRQSFKFSERDLRRIDQCEKALFPPQAAGSRTRTSTVRVPARNLLDHHETPTRVLLPAGVWHVGYVPYLSPFARRLHAQLASPPEEDFSFSVFVRQEAFWIDTHEHAENGSTRPRANISFDEARAVCQKLGGDLPTEDQWEIAARGASYYRVFPFGETIPPACFGETGEICGKRKETMDISPWGVWHMGSGLSEWVLPSAVRKAPPAGMAITRGGSSSDPFYWNLVAARRLVPAQTRADDIGFRCVYPAAKTAPAVP